MANDRQDDSRADVTQALEHIDTCLFDISDPLASPGRKRRAQTWLSYWRADSGVQARVIVGMRLKGTAKENRWLKTAGRGF